MLDFTLSDKGQALWANAFLRPVRPSAMSPEVAANSCLIPVRRAKFVDWTEMADAQKKFNDRIRTR